MQYVRTHGNAWELPALCSHLLSLLLNYRLLKLLPPAGLPADANHQPPWHYLCLVLHRFCFFG